jgi:osmoprotectant transport system permease protein
LPWRAILAPDALTLFAQLRIHHRTSNCVDDNGVCPKWIVDNFDRYTKPLVQHIELTLISVAIGFAIAFGLAMLAHRRRWLIAPITQVTGILYTLPSVAVFFLLLPLTGRGRLTAIIALVAYSLLIIFRNVITGLDGVPAEARDAGRGMGLTENQLLWRVELPLALPEILAGLRIAVTTTVGLAALAFLAGAGGLGDAIFADVNFRSNVLVAGGLCVALAVALDLLVLALQRAITPWLRAAR